MRGKASSRSGFTLMELLIGSAIMVLVILGALSLYVKSNKISVDQQQYAEVQQDIRTCMYFVTRDARMAGADLPVEFAGYFLEGTDNDTVEGTGGVLPDRLKIMGNIDEPLVFHITAYQAEGASLSLEDYSFEKYPYADSYYNGKVAMVLPDPASTCRAAELRTINTVSHGAGGTNEQLNFVAGLTPGVVPPSGLEGSCASSSDYSGGTVTWIDVKEYWLDVTGNYPGLTAGVDGYIGGGTGGVLYLTHNGVHYPIARNIENLQFQYNGDLNNDGVLDGFVDWNPNWTTDEISRIISVRVLILGRTPSAATGFSGALPTNIYLYRRPAMANSDAATSDDLHRRFLLESTANVRNNALNIYNNGVR